VKPGLLQAGKLLGTGNRGAAMRMTSDKGARIRQ
jgi:hypothetical protein